MGSDIHGVFQRKSAEGDWRDVPSTFEENRHYLLFAWLGDVRNGFGCAGIPTHTAVEPLSSQRGYPEDFVVMGDKHPTTKEDLNECDQEYFDPKDPYKWMGDHSHSWVSAKEVLEATPPKILRTGVIPLAEFKKWDGETGPESWIGGIDGPGILVSSPSDIVPATTHVRIEWFEDTKESLAYFINEVKRLADEHSEVRYVFGFDS
jgi:hypothetical protein